MGMMAEKGAGKGKNEGRIWDRAEMEGFLAIWSEDHINHDIQSKSTKKLS